jgi:hypothetical protein
VGVDHLLDLPGVHVLTAGDDHVLLPVDDVEEPLFVPPGHVTRLEPPAVERRLGPLLVAPVALEHLLGLDHDLTDDTGRALVHRVVDDLDVGQAHRRAARGQEVLLTVDRPDVDLLRVDQHVAAQFGHPEPGVDDRPEPFDRRLEHLHRHRRRSVADVAQRRQVVVVDLRVLQQEVEHRRRQRRRGDPVTLDELHEQLRLVRLHQHDEPAAQVHQRDRVPRDVTERKGEEVPIVGLRLVLDHRLEDGRDQVAMGEHRPLREPGGSARVDQPGGVVLVDLDRRARRRAGGHQLGVGDRPVRVTADHHDVLDRRDRGQLRADLLEERLLDDEHPRLGVAEDPRPFLGVQPVVQERQRHPGCRHPVVALHELGHVLRQDRHPVTRRGQSQQTVGETVDVLVELAVGDLAVAVDESRPARLLTGVEADDVREQHQSLR